MSSYSERPALGKVLSILSHYIIARYAMQPNGHHGMRNVSVVATGFSLLHQVKFYFAVSW